METQLLGQQTLLELPGCGTKMIDLETNLESK
jgi:hypothetical protein